MSMTADTAIPSDYEDLKRKLSWRGDGPARGRVLSVFMDQNNRCNLKCKMCGFSDPRVSAVPKYDMPRELFDAIAAQIFPQTNFLVLSILTEPFMTRDFPDRLTRVREFEIPYSEIITNGTLLNETSIRKIIEARITCLTFSIDGGNKETYEAIRVGARFQAVMYNVSLFQSMRRNRRAGLPALRINHVLSELNIDRFDDFLALVGKVRPERIGVRTVSRMSNALVQENREPAFWAKVGEAREKLAAFCKRTGIENAGYLRDRPTPIDLLTDEGERMICRAPWEAVAIHPNGDVYPCMAWTRQPIGNLRLKTFREIWTGKDLAALRREFEDRRPGLDCLNCSVRSDGSPEKDDFFYRKIAKPLAPRPEIAEKSSGRIGDEAPREEVPGT